MDKELTGTEAAQCLGIHPNTLSQWETQLGLKVEMGSGRRKRYTPEIMAVLEEVKNLRGDDAGFRTIRKRLNIEPQVDQQGGTVPQVETLVSHRGEPDPITSELLGILREKDAKIEALNKQLNEVSMVAAQYQERSSNLGEQLLLLTSGSQVEPAKRPWWKFWN